MQAGIPCWTIPGISWRRRTTPPQSPAQPSVCALFAVSPDNCKPTAAPPGSPGVCFGTRNSNPGESYGNSIKRVVSAKVSCELLWFECGFVNPFPSRRFGRCSSLHLQEVKILMVNFEELVCVWFEMQARCWAQELCPAHIGFICRDSITPFPLGWFSEPLGRHVRNSDQDHCENMLVWPLKRWSCFLGVPSLDNYGEFFGGPLRPCRDKQTKEQHLSGVDGWNCMREKFGHWTSSVLSVFMGISHPFIRNGLDTFYPCSRQKLCHGHIRLLISLLNLKYTSYALHVVIAIRFFWPLLTSEFLALPVSKAPHFSGGWAAHWAVHKWHFCHPSASSAREGILQILWQYLCSSQAMSYPWHILKRKLFKTFTSSFPPRIWTKQSSVFWAKSINFFSCSVDHRNSYRHEE